MGFPQRCILSILSSASRSLCERGRELGTADDTKGNVGDNSDLAEAGGTIVLGAGNNYKTMLKSLKTKLII